MSMFRNWRQASYAWNDLWYVSKNGRSTCSSTCHICLVQRPICWKPLNPPRPSKTFSVSFHSPWGGKQHQRAIWTVRHSSWTLPSFLRHNSPSCPLRPLSCTDIGFVWPFHLDFPHIFVSDFCSCDVIFLCCLRSDRACNTSALFKCAWSHFKSDQASCVKYQNQSYFWLVKNFKGRFSLCTVSKWTYFCASWLNFHRSLVWAWLHSPIFSTHLQHLSELK